MGNFLITFCGLFVAIYANQIVKWAREFIKKKSAAATPFVSDDEIYDSFIKSLSSEEQEIYEPNLKDRRTPGGHYSKWVEKWDDKL